MRWRGWIIVLALAAAACETSSQQITGTSEPTADNTGADVTPDAALARIGDSITLAGIDEGLQMEITLVKVVDPAKADEFFGPDQGNRFVAVQLRLTNVGTLNYDDSPSNGAVLIDVDDQQYTSAIFDSAVGAPLGSPKIAVGASRLGFITFEIPEGIELALFQFTLDSGFGPETGEWIVG